MDSGDEFVKRIESLAEYIEFLKVAGGLTESTDLWFRGQKDATWGLIPSVFRNNKLKENEVTLLARFRQKAASHGARYAFDDWGWLVFAQHHGIPTRLLDWSESPLVALYFATASDGDAATDGRVFVLNPQALNLSAGDIEGQLHLLSDKDQTARFYYPETSTAGHVPRAVLAPQLFDRLRFQNGIFTVSTPPAPGAPENDPLKGSSAVESVLIPWRAKAAIRRELALLGFNETAMYMDLDRIACQIKEQVKESTC